MLDTYLMTICGDRAATMAMRMSALYNWAKEHSVQWTDIVRADNDDLLIAVLNGVSLKEARDMLLDADIKLGQKT